MKKLFAFLFAGMLSASMLSANEVQAQQGISGLQSQELEFLFGVNANVNDLNITVLSEEEMKEIKGEGFFTVLAAKLGIGVGIGLARYGYCRWKGGNGCSFKVDIKYPL